jgi:lipoprotein-anchoring transpeptidase ErfK/SrfK
MKYPVMENNDSNTFEILPDNEQDAGKSQGSAADRLRKLFKTLKDDPKIIAANRILIKSLLLLFAIIFVICLLTYMVPVMQEAISKGKIRLKPDQELKNDNDYKKQITSLQREIRILSGRYSVYTPGQSYIVINTTDNRFFLYRNKKLIREGYCSSGSYIMLKTEGERKWIFKTPKGKYRIQGKITSPVWRKPDWAFVEEGLPIPPQDHPSRYEYGVLGDYAMSIGDGYLIHGTLYKRFLGMPVTHGCVRLNDEDLKAIYNTLSIGSKVYIF